MQNPGAATVHQELSRIIDDLVNGPRSFRQRSIIATLRIACAAAEHDDLVGTAHGLCFAFKFLLEQSTDLELPAPTEKGEKKIDPVMQDPATGLYRQRGYL